MLVSKDITLSQITDILIRELDVLEKKFRLKLEVQYKVGSLDFPIIEIEDDDDLLVFISETLKTKIPLCVTRVLKDGVMTIREDTVEGEYQHERK
nr:ankyrin repeat family protein [Tanacetum cinerariifolium]